jgi:hypothetical protein
MSRHIQGRLKRLEELVGSPEQRRDPEARERVRDFLDLITQARRDGELTEEDRAKIRTKIAAVRAVRRETKIGGVVNGRLPRN